MLSAAKIHFLNHLHDFYIAEQLMACRLRFFKLQHCIDAHENKLIEELRTIYPIKQSVDGRCLQICGCSLPNSDFSGTEDLLIVSVATLYVLIDV